MINGAAGVIFTTAAEHAQAQATISDNPIPTLFVDYSNEMNFAEYATIHL